MSWELKLYELQKKYLKEVNQLMISLYNTDIKRLWKLLNDDGGYTIHNKFEMCDSKYKCWFINNGFIFQDENRKYIVKMIENPFGYSEGFELRESLRGEKAHLLYRLELYNDYPISDFDLQMNNRKEILANQDTLFNFLMVVGLYLNGLEDEKQ